MHHAETLLYKVHTKNQKFVPAFRSDTVQVAPTATCAILRGDIIATVVIPSIT